MNKRQTELIRYLIKNGEWIKGNQLASIFNVSARTIRNDIQAIQSSGLEIKTSKKNGYLLENQTGIANLLEQSNEFPESAYERKMFILRRLLHISEPQNIYDLADDLFVSESTVEKDMYRLKELISNAEPKIELKRIENNFVLEGNTRAKRTLWSKLLINEVKNNLFDITAFENQFNKIKLKEINEILNSILPNHNIYLNDLSILSMVIHVAIIADTILRNGETISTAEVEFICPEEEVSAARQICGEIEALYSISIPLPEIEYIAILLGGKNGMSYKDEPEKSSVLAANSDFIALTKNLIGLIHDQFLVDLSEDDKLIFDLSMHLRSLYDRNKRGVEIHNPILADTQKKFPLTYDMGIFMGLRYQEKTGQKLNEDEIGLLTLHLCIAFERLEKGKSKFRLAILCPTGETTSRLMKVKLENIYGDKIGEMEQFSIYDKKAINGFKPNLILITTELPEKLSYTTIKVSPFLPETDIHKINQHLHLEEGKTNTDDITSYFRKQLFFKDVKVRTPKDAITFLCDQLEKEGIVPSGYNELIMAREAISSTAFGNMIALPHPIEKVANQTVIAVCLLKQPIMWGNKEVQLILLFALANDKKELMDGLFRKLIDLLDNPVRVKEIIQVKSYGALLQLIE